MLQSIRDHTQGWIAGIIISLLILSFALWGIHSYLMSGSVHNTVATVNGIDITKSQLAVTYERLRRQLQAQYANSEIPANIEATLKERSLQSLIQFQILKQASFKEGYRISQKQVDGFLYGMPEFQVNGQFSFDRFKQILSTSFLSSNEFIELIKNTLLIDQPRLGMIFTSYALPNEVSNTLALVTQTRAIQYFILPFQLIETSPMTVSEEDIKKYYQQHQSEYKTQEQLNVEYIELSIKDIANKIHPTEDELKNFYNENANSFTEPALWNIEKIRLPLSNNASQEELKQAENKINDVYKKAKEGKDFSSLTKEYSLINETPSAPNWLTLSQLPETIQKSINYLKKPGDISQPVRVKDGFVIIKVVAYKEINILPYDKIKNRVTELYIQQKAEEQFADAREKLASLAYEHPDSLDPAAKELGLNIQTSELFTKEKGGKDITANSKIREASFSDDVLNLGNNSDVIQNGPNSIVVLRMKSHTPAELLPLKAVKEQITEKLKLREINSKTYQLANEIVAKLKKGADPEKIVQEYHLNWTHLGLIERHSTTIDSAILDLAFAMPKPYNNKLTYAAAKVQKGYVIVGLKAIQNGTSNDLDQYRVFAEQIQNTQGLLEYELYKQSLLKQAKIEVQNL